MQSMTPLLNYLPHVEPCIILLFSYVNHISSIQSKDAIEGLFEEVCILQEIHHPHVLKLHAFFEDDKSYSLVTEILDGGELFDRIVQKNHYNEKVARDLVRVFLLALDFLHTNGVIHRDLKVRHASRHSERHRVISMFSTVFII